MRKSLMPPHPAPEGKVWKKRGGEWKLFDAQVARWQRKRRKELKKAQLPTLPEEDFNPFKHKLFS